MKTEAEFLTKTAAQILNTFGYVNIKPSHLTALECSGEKGYYDYILVGFEDKLFQLRFKDDGETKSWNLLERKNEI